MDWGTADPCQFLLITHRLSLWKNPTAQGYPPLLPQTAGWVWIQQAELPWRGRPGQHCKGRRERGVQWGHRAVYCPEPLWDLAGRTMSQCGMSAPLGAGLGGDHLCVLPFPGLWQSAGVMAGPGGRSPGQLSLPLLRLLWAWFCHYSLSSLPSRLPPRPFRITLICSSCTFNRNQCFRLKVMNWPLLALPFFKDPGSRQASLSPLQVSYAAYLEPNRRTARRHSRWSGLLRRGLCCSGMKEEVGDTFGRSRFLDGSRGRTVSPGHAGRPL